MNQPRLSTIAKLRSSWMMTCSSSGLHTLLLPPFMQRTSADRSHSELLTQSKSGMSTLYNAQLLGRMLYRYARARLPSTVGLDAFDHKLLSMHSCQCLTPELPMPYNTRSLSWTSTASYDVRHPRYCTLSRELLATLSTTSSCNIAFHQACQSTERPSAEQ